MARIEGTHNHDSHEGTEDADQIYGLAGDDKLSGLEGPDILYGGAGDDFLYGGPGSDILMGGAGDDQMSGGEGDDVYVIDGPGWGRDYIDNDANGILMETDVIQIGGGILPADITVARVLVTGFGDALVLRMGDDRITVSDHFSPLNGQEYMLEGVRIRTDHQIDGVRFLGDGTFWDKAALLALASGTHGNRPPQITAGGPEVTVAENSAFVATLRAHDPDGDPLSWSFSIGRSPDLGAFDFDEATGVLSFRTPPDFETPADHDRDNVYVVTAMVSDGRQSDTREIRVRVTDVAESLAITSNGGGATARITMAENGLAVTRVVAGPGGGGSVGYAIAGGADAGLFTMDAATGALRFSKAPDFETPADQNRDNLYSVTVAARSGGLTASQDLAIRITDLPETIRGTPRADSIAGTRGADSMAGGRGDDVYVVNHAGDRVIEKAGEGTDLVRAGVSHGLAAHVEDLVLTGRAAINGAGNLLGNAITGNDAANLLRGLGGADILRGGGGADRLYGGKGADSLFGGAGNDRLHGDAGNDRLEGGQGADRLYGGGGRDSLFGGAGHDRLEGGSGGDVLHGGGGRDMFVFAALRASTPAGAGRDRIMDFTRGDRIDLSAIDAVAGQRGDQAFDFIGRAAFSGASGELRFARNGADTLVQGDVNGDGRADFAILLTGAVTLGAGDFLL